ncbi:MAG: hypothetical protein HC915_13110 [Anaerolineae bacterium]|nr:hypothetical protein [Anaerolineae bacterium]
MGSFGRDIRDQILILTKQTLKRAMTNIDFGVNMGEEEPTPVGEKPKRRRVEINIRSDDDPTPPRDRPNPDMYEPVDDDGPRNV